MTNVAIKYHFVKGVRGLHLMQTFVDFFFSQSVNQTDKNQMHFVSSFVKTVIFSQLDNSKVKVQKASEASKCFNSNENGADFWLKKYQNSPFKVNNSFDILLISILCLW